MIKYARHRPAFFEGFDEPTDNGAVVTVDDLLALDWVARWKDEPEFQYFCWSPGGSSDLLMIQMKSSYWVIAYLRGDLDDLRARLPEWKSSRDANSAGV
jgi:hypothetical protein